MNKTIATLALTLFAGTVLTAAMPATDAEAGVRKHCVKQGKVMTGTACDTRLRKKRRPTFPQPANSNPTRRTNLTPNTDFTTERGGGGNGGGGGGAGNR
jgi:hypothetical protein